MLTVDTNWFSSDLWTGSPLRYRSGLWPDPHIERLLTFVNYTQVKRLPFRLDAFYVLKSDTNGTASAETKPGDLLSHTLGFQAGGTLFKALDAGGTCAVQFGRQGGDKVRAQGASGKVGVTFPLAWAPRIGTQLTWGSGDSDPHDGIHETFDGVYGGRDIYFYGYLNLFFWANLSDFEVDFSLRPHRLVTVNAEYHRFALDQLRDAWYSTGLQAHRRDPSGRSGRNLGDEIDALLKAVRAHLTATGCPTAGRRLVWVSGSRAWYSSTESCNLPHEAHEATAYASVYKYSHDVAPAKAALGAGGCIDCHRTGSAFFQGAVLAEPFGGDEARPLWIANQETLAISSFWVRLGAFREASLKPIVYTLLAAALILLAGLAVRELLGSRLGWRPRAAEAAALTFAVAGVAVLIGLLAFALNKLVARSRARQLDSPPADPAFVAGYDERIKRELRQLD